MDPAYVLLTVVIALIAVGAKVLSDVHHQCDKTSNGLIVVKTKLDMLLEIAGLDPRKVNRAIKEHIDELKQDGAPSSGCINIEELYKDKED
jgi:hypothetical protein